MLDPSFFSYVTVMSITPGPNNLLLAASGVNFGMRRTIPMAFGILLGCTTQTAIASVALEMILYWMKSIRLPLTLVGCTYLVWLSWKILRAKAPQISSKDKPMTMLGAACFQAINPKAWLMASNVALLYSSHNNVLFVLLGFMLLNLPCILIWVALGDHMRKHLQIEWKRCLFNWIMSSSLMVTTIWMLIDSFSA